MWKRRRLFFIGGGILILVICVQLLYPYETTLPFARAFDQPVGYQRHNEIAARFQASFEKVSIQVKSSGRSATTSLSKLGAELNTDRMSLALTHYPLWQRFIPFSIAVNQPRIEELDVTMRGIKMEQASIALAQQLSSAPTDASFTLQDGALTVVKAQPGETVTPRQVRDSLIVGRYLPNDTVINVKGVKIDPARNDSQIESAKQQAVQTLERSVAITVNDTTFTPDKKVKASWLVVKNTEHSSELSIDKGAVARYVSEINDTVRIAPKPTTVQLTDGKETDRIVGESGAALNIPGITNRVVAALSGSEPLAIEAELQPVEPQVRYNRAYTNTQEGLRAYVVYLTSTQNVRIAVQQIDGPGWSASGRADESIPSASTYKLYVMMRVFDEINNGSLTWDAPMLDTTAGGCFERVIVPSTNPCAEEWIRRFGREALNEYVYSKGFSRGTGFTFPDATHTTAGDLAKYLIGLSNGSLISGSNRDMLLEKMSRQLYRTGIPSGVKATRVEDKVGFLWDYIHDAAIVHKPQGSYVLVIMTKGYSYNYIATVAKQIDTIMYP